MKRVIFFLFISSIFVSAQMRSVGSVDNSAQLVIMGSFGYTIVDVSEAMGFPEAVGVSDGLTDWDNINYKGQIQLLFSVTKTISVGPEIGISRIYFWERKYTPFGFSPRWEADDVGTWHFGGVIRFQIEPSYYFLTGICIHTFFNDSGTTAGVPVAFGHEIKLSQNLKIPLEFRCDIIFGDATPISIGGGVGVKFGF